MTKNILIDKITEYNADLVWELDQSKYYGMIGWNGVLKNGSYWLNYNLENMTVSFLKGLLKYISLL